MFPHFANPHLRAQDVKIVSRSALREDGEDGGKKAAGRSQLLDELEGLLKRSLGDLASTIHELEGGRESKRRRTDLDVATSLQADALPFRLVSGPLPPKPIQLQEKSLPVIHTKEPPAEDDADEAALRASRARAIAVDFDWVVAESHRPHVPPPNSEKKLIHVAAQLPSPPPALMVAELPKSRAPTPKLVQTAKPSDVRPSPHALPTDPLFCPIIDVFPAGALVQNRKKPRRRGHKPPRERPQPMFWRPLVGTGAGYAMGYEGSWPVREGDPARYTYNRDSMRKGVLFGLDF